MAEIYLNTPFYKGHTCAVVIDSPLYPLIIGNIPGVDDSLLTLDDFSKRQIGEQEKMVSQAVVTRESETTN